MPTSSITEFDELNNEIEIIFTATPEFDEHFNSIPQTAASSATVDPKKGSEQIDTNTELEKASDHDAVAKQQVDRLKAKLETHQQLRETTEAQAKQLRFKQLINETRGLNKESEKFNTQSAVLLSALTGLRNEFEASEDKKSAIVAKLSQLSNNAQGLLHELKLSKADADESLTLSLTAQQTSDKLISDLSKLRKDTLSQQQAGSALLDVLEKDIGAITRKKASAEDKANEIIELVNNSHELLEQANLANRQAFERSGELESALEFHQIAKADGESLTKSLLELKQGLLSEKETQQRLNQQSKTQIQQTQKLNEQQTTLIELTQSRHEELRNELSSSLETVKKYQNKLQLTEAKLKDAGDLQARYKDQYSDALSKLESNETLLKNAAKALAETNGQNGKFNSSISKFQHSTEQSQQLVIRTQTTLESILTRNQLLERENKLLAQKINSFSSASTSAPPRADPPASSNMGFGSLNEFNFGDHQSSPQAPMDNRNGFFKLMVVLAIVIPLSFIAHSLFNSANAKQLTSLDNTVNPVTTKSTERTEN
jgi:chromosome segregation ATPase